MPQHFFCALALTVTLTTNLTPMTRDNDHRDGSKLTLPRFDPKDPTFFDDLQAYAQDRGLGWLLHADGEDTKACCAAGPHRGRKPNTSGSAPAPQHAGK